MNGRPRNGLFVAEGTSDLPLADLVEALFLEHGALVRLRKPDFSLLPGVKKDVASRVRAGMRLEGPESLALVVVHREVCQLASWKSLVADVQTIANQWMVSDG